MHIDWTGGNPLYLLTSNPAFSCLPLPGIGNTAPKWSHVLFTLMPPLHCFGTAGSGGLGTVEPWGFPAEKSLWGCITDKVHVGLGEDF